MQKVKIGYKGGPDQWILTGYCLGVDPASGYCSTTPSLPVGLVRRGPPMRPPRAGVTGARKRPVPSLTDGRWIIG
jgi:hypothetical protein